MKKCLFLFLFTTIILISAACTYAQELTSSFDWENNSLEIEITNLSPEVFFTVSIAHEDKGKVFSKENTPDIMQLYRSEESEFSVTIPLQEAFKSGKYNILIRGENINIPADYILLTNESDENTLAVTALLNSAEGVDSFLDSGGITNVTEKTKNNAKLIGIDAEKISSDKLDYAMKFCFEHKNQTEGFKFSPDSFLDTFEIGLICSVLTVEKDAHKAIKDYAASFGTTYDAYIKLDKNVKSSLNLLLCEANFLGNNPADIYREALLAANIKNVDAWGYLQEELIKEKEFLGLDLSEDSEYSKIAENKRYLVFENLFEIRTQLKDRAGIKSAFDTAVAEVLKEAEKGDDEVSSSVGGGGSGGTVIYKPITEDKKQDETAEDSKESPGQEELSRKFTDMKDHFSLEAVTELAQKNIINGFPDGSFRPDDSVTRAEFAKMIVLLFELQISQQNIFSDVSDNDWFSDYVFTLADYNIMVGSDGRFNPEAPVKREEAAVIIYRLAQWKSIPLTGEGEFYDSEEISDYAGQAVGALSNNLVMIGNDGFFYPKNSITRGETAVLLCRAYEKLSGGGQK